MSWNLLFAHVFPHSLHIFIYIFPSFWMRNVSIFLIYTVSSSFAFVILFSLCILLLFGIKQPSFHMTEIIKLSFRKIAKQMNHHSERSFTSGVHGYMDGSVCQVVHRFGGGLKFSTTEGIAIMFGTDRIFRRLNLQTYWCSAIFHFEWKISTPLGSITLNIGECMVCPPESKWLWWSTGQLLPPAGLVIIYKNQYQDP